MPLLERRTATVVFLAFAFAYFFSALVRAITATLSPVLTQEFTLNARDLGLLAGGYFLGFAATQLPLGTWLDRHGPKKVILCFLTVAVAGCLAFSWATSFTGLLTARLLCGAGVSACLMAPLTGYRRWFSPGAQLRSNSWMLMTGSFGMLASTLPVQWLMPVIGWRAMFWLLAAMILLSMAVIAWRVPKWRADSDPGPDHAAGSAPSYAEICKHPYFRKMGPVGFFNYGGFVAIQTLWAGPWMVKVGGYTPLEAATGLFFINLFMLCTFWAWGFVNPMLVRRGIPADQVIAWGLPLSFGLLAALVVAGPALGTWSAAALALYCMSCTSISLSQPAVGMVFPQAVAGRALSAYNLVIFAGVFVVQWGIGLAIDGFQALGLAEVVAFQSAMAVFLACCVASYGYFLVAKPHNRGQ
jgi:MFS family permease